MKKTFILSSLIAVTLATPSFATPTELDKKTVASKAYVDTKQDIIETGLVEFTDGTMLPAFTTYDSTNGLVSNKIGILDMQTIWDDEGNLSLYSDSGGGYGSEMDNFVPTVRAVAEALHMKQDKITTGLVEFNGNPDFMLPAITTYDSTSGLVSNKIGILDWQTIHDDEGNLSLYSDSGGGYGSEMDNFVPTVRAVAEGLATRQDILPAAWASTTNVYSMASTGGQTIELGASNGSVDRRYITAGGSQPLTKKTGADNVILYINGTKTLAQYQTSNFGAPGSAATKYENYIKGALVSLELLKDVYSELNAKITNNALPTGTTGTVVTYNGTNPQTGVQEFGERAVYDPANAYNAQNDATKLATAGFVETKQNKMVCAGWDSDTHTDEHCWLWSIE